MLALLIIPGLSVGAARAEAPAVEASYSFYLLAAGQPEAAAWNAAAALHADPEDLVAHRAYVVTMATGLRENAAVMTLYRSWLAEAPESEVARIGLATALHYSHNKMGPWCDELEAALGGVEGWSDPFERYWAHRVRYQARDVCPGERDSDRAALLELGAQAAEQDDLAVNPWPYGYSLRLRLSELVVDDELAAALERWYQVMPHRAAYTGNLWHESVSGEGLERAQQAALAAARREAIASDDPQSLYDAAAVLRWSEDPDLPLAEERLALLDPARTRVAYGRTSDVQWMRREVRTWNPASMAVTSANSKIAVRAVRLLRDIEPPEDDPVLSARLQDKLGENLEATGRRRAALEAYHRAWVIQPTPDRANAYAYTAAMARHDLEPALAVIDAALAETPRWDPRGEVWVDGYDDWLRVTRDERAGLLDTRAWVLHELGRDAEAAAVMREALLLSPTPEPLYHLHLGIISHALGQGDEALFHLGRGLSQSEAVPWWEWSLKAHSRSVAKQLYRERRWAPGGLDDWIATQAPPELSPTGAPEVDDYRLGQDFPDLSFETLDGRPGKLSDYTGLVVVDLWATWCGPCVASLPHLSQVAEDYPDVPVIALSVDEERSALDDFAKRPRAPAYTEVWSGKPAMKEAKVRGIPATFVLQDGVIVGYFSGFGRGDTRLEAALDENR